MSKNYMVIIVKPPNRKPQVIKIPKRLKDMSNLVGGTIEEKRYEKILVVYNENQKDNSLENNNVFDDLKLKGTVLLIGNDENTGDIRSLSKKELVKYMSKMNCKSISQEEKER